MNKGPEVKIDGNRMDIKMEVQLCISSPEEYELLYGGTVPKELFDIQPVEPIEVDNE